MNSLSNMWLVPVIVVFTKFDALDDIAYEDLLERGISPDEATAQCEMHAMELFKQAGILDKLSRTKFPPGHTAFLRSKNFLLQSSCTCTFHFISDLNNPTSSIGSLLEETTSALDNRALQQLFVTSQLSNMKLSIKYSITDTNL
jgi:hypothetical protein